MVLKQKALYELPDADHTDINDLRNFVHNEEMGGRWLQHPEDTIWETLEHNGKYIAQQKDLVRLNGSNEARYMETRDSFTRWLWGPFLEFIHRFFARFKVPCPLVFRRSYPIRRLTVVLAREQLRWKL
jgi:hypothetical protein